MDSSLETLASKAVRGKELMMLKRRSTDQPAASKPVKRSVSLQPVAPILDANGNLFHPFELLNNDKIHSHILSFLMRLRPGYAPPPRNARRIYVKTKQQESVAANGSKPDAEVLEFEFQFLPQNEQLKWHHLAAQELVRYQVEDVVYIRSNHLTRICETLSLVSTRWRNVVEDCMNAQASKVGIITPRDLALLKSRVQSLQLERVCTSFMGMLRDEHGAIQFPPREYDWNDTTTMNTMSSWRPGESPLEVVLDYFAVEGRELHEVVVAEYARFLVIKCVETLASCREKDNYHAQLLPWKEACEPSDLVKLFWKAHLQFPQQYARDCKMLLYPLWSPKNEIDYIMDYDRRYISMHEYIGSDYTSKRDFLFTFESQLANDPSFYGRFGDDWMPDPTEMLFEDIFHVVKVAEACRDSEEAIYSDEESRI